MTRNISLFQNKFSGGNLFFTSARSRFLSGEDFQADDRSDQRRDEEQPPEAGGFLEDQDADEDGSHGADTRPYRIGRPDRDRLTRFGKKKHAEG